MEELKFKIAEWCGFTIIWEKVGCVTPYCKYAPDGNWCDESPDFTTSLDACFEYIVPKLLHKDVYILHHSGSPYPECQIRPIAKEPIIVVAETPALALCRAVEKLIDGQCDHDWIKVRNEVVTSGEMCSKCHAVRAELIDE